MPPSTPDEKPWVQVAYRDLLWLASLGRPLTHRAAVDAVQGARQSLGLQPFAGGRASDLMQRFTKGYALFEQHGGEPLFKKVGRNLLEPVARNWAGDWRLLYAPRHDTVRSAAGTGSLLGTSTAAGDPAGGPASGSTWHFRPHDPVLPEVDVVVGLGDAAAPELARFIATRAAGRFANGVPGVYVYARGQQLYVGQTDEVITRERLHRRAGSIEWFAFFTPDVDETAPDPTVISAAEALLIRFWDEISPVTNGNRGRDKPPASLTGLRVAAGLSTSVSAALVRLHKEGAGVVLPVHPKLVPGYFQFGGPPLPASASAKAAASARRRLERDPASVPAESS